MNMINTTPNYIENIPEKLILHIFSYLHLKELGKIARVCRKWRNLAYDPRLWECVSLRPEYNGLSINHTDYLMNLIHNRFGSKLRYIEMPSDLITPSVLHDLAAKCPSIKYMTLDFSKAMQLHDFNDLNSFPCNMKSLCICLSEVIFMEGFMRRIYQCLNTLQVLHLIGTFELSNEEEEEIFEVINIAKIKAHTPNLRLVNLYGINFVDDSHVELLASNCIHLECLALNFCLRVKGAAFSTLIQRCRKLTSLLLHHTSVADEHMMAVPWEKSQLRELDITSTEMSAECLLDILPRMPGFRYLAVGHCDFFDDKVLDMLIQKNKLRDLIAIDISHNDTLSENAINRLIQKHGLQLKGLILTGKPKLTEQFWLNAIPYLKNLKVCSMGTANGWFLKLTSRVHVDQIISSISQNWTNIERLEMQWDPDTIRFGDNSSKFIDLIRLRCPRMKSMTLSDGEYYEMVKSNYERADRLKVVRTTTNYTTSIVTFLSHFNDLLFN
ncbi:unnamed protein product [Owenia fusiformis]|uniref:F-box domain-containing protein n=1 Tax=Owenia fusiformis TaxID=6347 RepID=A0A8S4NX05_OWEFU|nr:unnamed protein product [Owenia fusiformis]